jgi:hypothetical protein
MIRTTRRTGNSSSTARTLRLEDGITRSPRLQRPREGFSTSKDVRRILESEESRFAVPSSFWWHSVFHEGPPRVPSPGRLAVMHARTLARRVLPPSVRLEAAGTEVPDGNSHDDLPCSSRVRTDSVQSQSRSVPAPGVCGIRRYAPERSARRPVAVIDQSQLLIRQWRMMGCRFLPSRSSAHPD